VEIFGLRLVGINADSGKKLLLSFAFIAFVVLMRRSLRFLLARLPRREGRERVGFWLRQMVQLAIALLLLMGLISIWFDDPARLTTGLGLVTAGLAFALQKVVTAVAGYFVILRGKTFSVGDRIVMGGVRGDVIAVRFTQTVIMEMGQPPSVEQADPAVWVRARQYTGRIVTVSNAKIFDEPVYNYTLDFQYIWEELSLPIAYDADRGAVEEILMTTAQRHTVTIGELSEEALEEMRRRYFLRPTEIGPKVYFRLTNNWLEVTVRFIVEDRGIREVKDAMSRDVLRDLQTAGIDVASATFEVTRLPPLRIHQERADASPTTPGDRSRPSA
jgi:small-conductance mechanosensitive channel